MANKILSLRRFHHPNQGLQLENQRELKLFRLERALFFELPHPFEQLLDSLDWNYNCSHIRRVKSP